MDYLIDCLCGHDLTRHDESGCRGNSSSCTCRRSKREALDGAIDEARTNPWTAPAPMTQPRDTGDAA